MNDRSDRWVEVAPSRFDHEIEGLGLVRALLPDEAPFRAWSNFEFMDSSGAYQEVDLLVLGRRWLHLVELKYLRGRISGDEHRWIRSDGSEMDSPLKLAHRKAQRLASRLKEQLVRTDSARIAAAVTIPYVKACVFLHHP